MIFESIYTSSDKSLVSGQVGFSTIAHTEGMSPQLIQRLEHLSLYPRRNKELQSFSPSVYFHLLIPSGSQTYHVLSRIVDCGFDYTGRTNYLAHHFVLTDDELPSSGPTGFLMSAPFLNKWDSGPTYLPPRTQSFFHNTISQKTVSCPLWNQWSGDPYWSLSLFEKVKQRGITYVIIHQKIPILQLFDESLNLLVPGDRWKISFCTYSLQFPVDIDCSWQGVHKESMNDSMNIERSWSSNANVVNLTKSLPEYFQHSPELVSGSIRLDTLSFEKPEKNESKPGLNYDKRILNLPPSSLKFSLSESPKLHQPPSSLSIERTLDYGSTPYDELYLDDLDNNPIDALTPEENVDKAIVQKPLPTFGQTDFDQFKTTPLRIKRGKKTLFNKIFYSLILSLWGIIVFILFVILLSFFTSCQSLHSVACRNSLIPPAKPTILSTCPTVSVQKNPQSNVDVFLSIPFQGDFLWL